MRGWSVHAGVISCRNNIDFTLYFDFNYCAMFKNTAEQFFCSFCSRHERALIKECLSRTIVDAAIAIGVKKSNL